MMYSIICEHVGGQSISHPCTTGLVEDPTVAVPDMIEAETAEAAETAASAILERLVSEAGPCACNRSKAFAARLGSEAWYNSVSIRATAAVLAVATIDNSDPDGPRVTLCAVPVEGGYQIRTAADEDCGLPVQATIADVRAAIAASWGGAPWCLEMI